MNDFNMKYACSDYSVVKFCVVYDGGCFKSNRPKGKHTNVVDFIWLY